MFSRIKRFYKEYKELKYLAYHDSLTGLLNRNWLYKNINEVKVKYVYFIDLNDLHEINKKGHTRGDVYIKETISTINHKGTLLRYAGDEFILFSNFENEVNSNDLYSVGFAIVKESLKEAIIQADLDMIRSKNIYKLVNKY